MDLAYLLVLDALLLIAGTLWLTIFFLKDFFKKK